MRRHLQRSFFAQPTLAVAKELLGKCLVRKIGRKLLVGKIVETEAYIGPEDRASHAFGGKLTPRNAAEYMIGGHVYIYLVYGMYWQLNISTGREGKPECVLIRALEPIQRDPKLIRKHPKDPNFRMRLSDRALPRFSDTNGPGKLCRWMKLDKSFYGEDVAKSKRLWLEDWGFRVKKSEIGVGPRIGIEYAGPVWAKKPWRFYVKGNPHVSQRDVSP